MASLIKSIFWWKAVTSVLCESEQALAKTARMMMPTYADGEAKDTLEEFKHEDFIERSLRLSKRS